MKENVLKDKSFRFAIRIVKLAQFLKVDKREFIISKPIVRSGTSIGALLREAEYAESKADFVHKLSIALKETNETEYWLDLLFESDLMDSALYESFKNDIKELLKLLISSIKTSKKLN